MNYRFVKQSNITDAPAYGVYTLCIVCIHRVCDSYKDFKLCHYNMCLKLYQYYKQCEHLKKTLHSHRLFFAKYDVWPEVALPVLASNTMHVMLHIQFSNTYIFNPTTVQFTMFCFSVFQMLVEFHLTSRGDLVSWL